MDLLALRCTNGDPSFPCMSTMWRRFEDARSQYREYGIEIPDYLDTSEEWRNSTRRVQSLLPELDRILLTTNPSALLAQSSNHALEGTGLPSTTTSSKSRGETGILKYNILSHVWSYTALVTEKLTAMQIRRIAWMCSAFQRCY